jgi:L-alanine-DL-glutamate epimerase-like enolase superfamily enzyme
MTSTAPLVRLRDIRLYRRLGRTRFPFRFGKASMTEMPLVYVRARWELQDGSVFEGVSASGIPPLWFDKRDGKTAADNEVDLLASLRAASAAYKAAGADTAWGLHKAVTEPVRDALVARGQAPLAAGFGPALLEAALVDGLCRQLGISFAESLRGALGLPEDILRALPARPLDRVAFRHTVGLADPLTGADVAAPLNDGLPETLEQVLATYRPAYLKVKINGDPAESRARLHGIAAVVKAAGIEYAVTLDGNEQFGTMEAFADFLDGVRADAGLAEFLEHTLWIEQPVRRDQALDPACAAAIGRVTAFRPVILDESDGEADALERGLALGYGGVSSKTCKGLFRSLGHLATLAKARAAGRENLIFSCEDLTTVPVHPLQQDLCLAAALGLAHAERNGHHYLRPSGFLTEAECRAALDAHPALYETTAAGELRVRITPHANGGGFDLRDVNNARGLGTELMPEWDALEEIKE